MHGCEGMVGSIWEVLCEWHCFEWRVWCIALAFSLFIGRCVQLLDCIGGLGFGVMMYERLYTMARATYNATRFLSRTMILSPSTCTKFDILDKLHPSMQTIVRSVLRLFIVHP